MARAVNPGIGPSDKFNLRVSVATLTRVVFTVPDRDELMLALEHKATLLSGDSDPRVRVRAQPFGGAVRLLDPAWLHDVTDGFAYDSQRSRDEGDFRVFIQPAGWPRLLNRCRRELNRSASDVLDTDPTRELVEEFADGLGFRLLPSHYSLETGGVVVEGQPSATESVRAPGNPTVRLYAIHEVTLTDSNLRRLLAGPGARQSAQVLRQAALEDARTGGTGRANGILAVALDRLRATYDALSPAERGNPLSFSGTVLAGNVVAVLGNIAVPKYERLPRKG